MKPASAKNKGRLFQKYIVKKILDTFKNLTERDVSSRSMGAGGEDIILSQKASDAFPFSIEAKNQESIQFWKALEQAESNRKELIPLLVFKRNRSDVYCTLKFDDFLGLIQNEQKTD